MTPASAPRRRSTSEQVIRRAVKECGHQLGPSRWHVPLTQRQLAAQLGMSIGTLRYHLAGSPMVVSLAPICVDFDAGPEPPPPPPPPAPARLVANTARSAASSPGPVIDATTSALSAPNTPNATVVALELLTTARALIELATTLLVPEAREMPRDSQPSLSRVSPRDPRPEPSRAPDSQSGFEEPGQTEELTDWTDAIPTTASRETTARDPQPQRATRPRENSDSREARVSRAPARDVTDEIAPLVELCRRTNLPGPDPAALWRIAAHPSSDVLDATRHVIRTTRAGGVNRPFGLLISVLGSGEYARSTSNSVTSNNATPNSATTQGAPSTVDDPPPTTATDAPGDDTTGARALVATLSDTECLDAWLTQVVPTLSPALRERRPPVAVIRAQLVHHLATTQPGSPPEATCRPVEEAS